ncbi:MAG: hypothetical protein H6R26_3498, partial [Proteobacteria bacterium]|nr:hypothetical protein [Pseudomonadota bacterium]
GATANQQEEEDSFQPPPLEEPETSPDEPWAATESEASARSDEGETGEPPDDRAEVRELGKIEEQFSEMAAQAADDISSGEKAASSPIVSEPPPPIPPTDQPAAEQGPPTKRSKPRGKKKKDTGSAEGAGDPA